MEDAASYFDGDPGLLDAEAQMAEYESDLFLDLVEQASARIPGGTKVFEVPLVILGLIKEDEAMREEFERLTALQYFRRV